METLKTHPAVKFGKWLKNARQSKGIVKRIFAAEIYLTPSKYSEVEAGVVRWVHELQEQAIEKTLELVETEIGDFKKLLQKAREAIALTFSHLFTRQQLEPMRLRSDNHRQPTKSDKDIILNAVFTPIL
jgi:transcriptional regulator with XRE-family HTH domain